MGDRCYGCGGDNFLCLDCVTLRELRTLLEGLATPDDAGTERAYGPCSFCGTSSHMCNQSSEYCCDDCHHPGLPSRLGDGPQPEGGTAASSRESRIDRIPEAVPYPEDAGFRQRVALLVEELLPPNCDFCPDCGEPFTEDEDDHGHTSDCKLWAMAWELRKAIPTAGTEPHVFKCLYCRWSGRTPEVLVNPERWACPECGKEYEYNASPDVPTATPEVTVEDVKAGKGGHLASPYPRADSIAVRKVAEAQHIPPPSVRSIVEMYLASVPTATTACDHTDVFEGLMRDKANHSRIAMLAAQYMEALDDSDRSPGEVQRAFKALSDAIEGEDDLGSVPSASHAECDELLGGLLALLREVHENKKVQTALDDNGSCVLCADWKDHRPYCLLYRIREAVRPVTRKEALRWLATPDSNGGER